ncbi:hypothetical protein Rhopal_004668-T1 [Rhodotorula paludigena]|uniref:RRM domain-containing protein n=1 Tax=Rhodotorula paludigena TaxID=86838 RepID=A0AAV5GP27_9BASI|nr:hypothetical protein Rhopal_004668-T1 [Rhodotorula paludigena]
MAFPRFELARLDFALDDLASLAPFQLALVAFHPSATAQHKADARAQFFQRRWAAEDAGEQVGLDEAEGELRALTQARNALAKAKEETRSRMKDQATQTGEKEPALGAVKREDGVELDEREGNRRLPTPISPPVQLPEIDLAPPGPVFSFDWLNNGPWCSRDLLKRFYTIRIPSLPHPVTVRLLHEYLLMRRRDPFPRPLAYRSTNTGGLFIAFRSHQDATDAMQRLNGCTLPLAKVKLQGVQLKPNVEGTEFRMGSLSEEVRAAWEDKGGLPEGARWVGQAPSPRRGVKVSEAYEAEWREIERKRRELAEAAMQHNERLRLLQLQQQQQQQAEEERFRLEQEDAENRRLDALRAAIFGYGYDSDSDASNGYGGAYKRARYY